MPSIKCRISICIYLSLSQQSVSQFEQKKLYFILLPLSHMKLESPLHKCSVLIDDTIIPQMKWTKFLGVYNYPPTSRDGRLKFEFRKFHKSHEVYETFKGHFLKVSLKY